ncbi:hypothetical protein [Kitasatospora mediocidica]|uniref:hypothetical protein n=1 Tax=Kitasatospora mediocidica TaxID=58352 RepID=UPI00055E4D71|nr:hypothetical protein [Kitasatospora mediocidica]
MTSKLTKHTAEARQDAADALEELLDALRFSSVPLVSVAVDWHSAKFTGRYLIDLGATRPDVARRMAKVLRAGAAHVEP